MYMYTHAATAVDGVKEDDVSVPFHIHVKVFKATCANTVGDDITEEVWTYTTVCIYLKESLHGYCLAVIAEKQCPYLLIIGLRYRIARQSRAYQTQHRCEVTV